MEQIPRPGELYRDLEGVMYQIVAVAEHAETGERMAVYQAMSGRFQVLTEPLDRFLQKAVCESGPVPDAGAAEAETQEAAVSPYLLSFLEEEDYGKKLELFALMRRKVTRMDLEILCEALDLVPPPVSDAGILADEIESYLEMRKKFSGTRLR